MARFNRLIMYNFGIQSLTILSSKLLPSSPLSTLSTTSSRFVRLYAVNHGPLKISSTRSTLIPVVSGTMKNTYAKARKQKPAKNRNAPQLLVEARSSGVL